MQAQSFTHDELASVCDRIDEYNGLFSVALNERRIQQYRDAIRFDADQIDDNANTDSGITLNKMELIDHIAEQADISKAAAGRALDAVGDRRVRATLKKGGTVTLVGFGTFAVGKRTARTGRNPRTGDAIKIKAAKVPKFRSGKTLKDALNF
ncbi:DNA-binding protein HU-beta [Candidatus Paraburkholderia kirkii UZHbot1]|uniref:DNA-binding protein HU-beta n=1 Tax=Candidatus Paraburkholderia kirkii UZHbot1 TaxID=1055526 RepID=G4MFB0_9BURK|nr:DNA-binding protein HU-beta [Candidatus Paraburkholderia kirkii UZHbot1]